MSIFKTISSLASSTLSVADVLDDHIKAWALTSSLELQVEFQKDLERAMSKLNANVKDAANKITTPEQAAEAVRNFRIQLRSL